MQVETKYANGYQDGGITKKWWLCDEGQAYTAVFATVQAIDTYQSYRRSTNARHMQLYGNLEALGIYTTMYDRSAVSNLLNTRLTLNVVKACVDTITSKVCKAKPRPLFLTQDGDYSQQKRAKQLTQYIDGCFDEMNIYDRGSRVFTDACLLDIGVMKFYTENGKVCAERILPFELVVDYAESIYGEPRQIHQKKFIDRDIMLGMFPDYKEKIMQASSILGPESFTAVSDAIAVVESWHLASIKGGDDGIHTICIENCTLLKEDYKKDYFPFTFLRWSPRVTGFFSMSLAEELYGIQIEINKTLRTLQLGTHLTSVPRVFIENGSQINTAHINNDVGAIVRYSGQPPVFSTPTAFPPEMYQYLDYLYKKGFEITGISLMSATSQKPAGLNAAVALREYQDIETERFMTISQRYEQFYIDAAKIVVDLSRDLYKTNKNLKVKAPNKKFIETIAWKDVNMPEDEYVIRVFPTSILPTTPAAKLQKIQEMVQAGWIDKDRGMLLLDFPDEESFVSSQTASIEVIDMIIESMIDKGEYQPPEPYMNLQQAKQSVQSAYLKARMQYVPEDRLELLRRFMDDCDAIVDQAMQAQQEAMQAQQAAAQPMANPQIPPRSDLLPLAPQGVAPQA